MFDESPGRSSKGRDLRSWGASPGPRQSDGSVRGGIRSLAEVSGSAATEYAVILGLLVLAVVGAYVLFGAQIESAVVLVRGRIPTGVDKPDAPRADRSRGDGADQGLASYEEPAYSPEDRLPAFALALGLAAPIAAWQATRLVRRSRKPREEADVPAPPIARPTPKAIQARAEAKRKELWRAFVADRDMLLQNHVRVRHLMTREVLSVGPATARDEVVKQFQSCRVSHLLVCDDFRRLLGVISNRDLCKRKGSTAAEVMTAEVVSVTPDTSISSAVSLLIERRISSLPVVEKDNVCGIITATDLLLTLQCALQMWLRASQDSSQPPELCEGAGLATRQELERFLAKMLAIRSAHGHAVSLVLAAFGGETLAGPRLMGATWLLAQHVRESDLLAYLGENRFAVVMPHTERDAAERISQAIQNAAGVEPLSSLGITVQLTAIAPRDGEDALDVLSRCESLALQPA